MKFYYFYIIYYLYFITRNPYGILKAILFVNTSQY